MCQAGNLDVVYFHNFSCQLQLLLLSCRFFFSRCTLAAFGTYLESITLIFELSEFSIAKSCSPFIFNSLSTCAIISHMPEY